MQVLILDEECLVSASHQLTWTAACGSFGVKPRPGLCIMSQLSTMDVLVWAATKGAAKCDKHCELQNSVNQQTPERIRHLRVFSQVGLVQCFYVLLAAHSGAVVLAQHRLTVLRSAVKPAARSNPRGPCVTSCAISARNSFSDIKHAASSDYPLNLSI